jgi:hypothetical protein
LLDVRLSACYDGGLYLHCAGFDLIPTEDHFKMAEQVKDSVDVNIKGVNALSCKWPYTCFSGYIGNAVFIMNAYDKDKLLHRIEIPGKIDRVCDTWITETNEVIIMA